MYKRTSLLVRNVSKEEKVFLKIACKAGVVLKASRFLLIRETPNTSKWRLDIWANEQIHNDKSVHF
jgi:hypothetical protein